MNITPSEDIHAIAIGPECKLTLSITDTYYFFDNLVLSDYLSFVFNIEEENHPCSPDYKLKVPGFPGLDYQWYKEGVALVGENDPELTTTYGDGSYQVRVMDGESCRLTLPFEYSRPVSTHTTALVVCPESTYRFGNQTLAETGTYTETFASFQGCDSIVTLNFNVSEETVDTIHEFIFEGEKYKLGSHVFQGEGEHLARLKSSIGCDSLVLVQLEQYKIFFPNVFTPNDDGFNDEFRVFGSEDLLKESSVTIYDRWGNVLSTSETWDGRFEGNPVMSGVYTYRAFVRLFNGSEHYFTGTVTLLK